MGSFEKLGILVIVVIIVMILVVAIYQWGATGMDACGTALPTLSGKPETLIVDYDNPSPGAGPHEDRGAGFTPAADAWASGIPKSYTIRNDDIVWKLVVKRWRLKETFIDAIKRANPGLNMKRLRAGNRLVIPDPQNYRPKSKRKPGSRRGTRKYVIQEGDLLESIAREHLGRRNRWGEIIDLNPGLNPRNLKLGDTIRLPAR